MPIRIVNHSPQNNTPYQSTLMLALTYDEVLLKKEFVHHNFVILKLKHLKVKNTDTSLKYLSLS